MFLVTMPQPTLNDIAQGLSDRLTEGRYELYESGTWLELLRQLSQGQPVATTKIAERLDLPLDKVSAFLKQSPDMEFDRQGNIVGMGLSLNPTPHQFQVNGHSLFTWCALDTLIYPVALRQTVQVTSSCPVTRAKVRLSVSPNGVNNLDPAVAVVSIVIPEASESCCRSNFCNQGHFFSSVGAASAWLAEASSTFILSVDEAFQVGYKVAQRRLTMMKEN